MHYSGSASSAITWTFTALMIIVWQLRLYTRLFLARNQGWEDLCISFAALNCIGLSITIQIQVDNGMGKHVWTLSQMEGLRSLQAFYASLTVYNLALTFTKVSILLQYLRVFTTRAFRIAAYVVFAIVGIYGLWALLASIFMCWPIPYFWNQVTIKGHCLNKFSTFYACAGMNILLDIILVVLPISPIQQLRLPKRQKRLLIIVFGIAGFVCIVSILRLQSLVQISRSKDTTWDNGPAATWSAIEANVGIICASLPPLRPLISRIAPSYGSAPDASPGYRYDSGIRETRAHSSTKRNSQPYVNSNHSKGAPSGSNESEEEIIGLKDMSAHIGQRPMQTPSAVGVQPATIVASSPPLQLSPQAFGTSPPIAAKLHGSVSREGPMSALTPLGKARMNSFNRREQRLPEANEIQVTTSMQQSVDVQPPGRHYPEGSWPLSGEGEQMHRVSEQDVRSIA